jgi:ribonuclease J
LSAKKSKLKVFSLGGLGEIGKNITCLEYGKDILIVDCGVAFPSDDMLGVDLVIPDFTYLVKNRERVLGVLLTHGHEDHIGSVPYLLKQINVKIFGTKLTLGLLENKLREHELINDAQLVTITQGEKFKLGVFEIEPINVTHSIADSVAFSVKTPVGLVIHSGDFKVDYTPIYGDPINLQRFAEIGQKGVLLFLCESTNIENNGYTLSEKNIGAIFDEIFDDSANRRIMVATFSSNIHRIQQIVTCAAKYKRKIAVMGRSMINSVRTACELGYLDFPSSLLIDVSEIKNFPDSQLVIIMTGSQGEPMAALSRMSVSEHRQVEVSPNDKIIISASPIPGNEKTISKLINELLKKGADVIYDGIYDVHVSGHAKREEIKLLHALVKPRFLMPIHGEYRHLKQHKDLAVSLGMDKDNVFIMGIGDVLELTSKSARLNGTAPAGQVLVDGLGIGDVGNIVLRDRKHLSQDGLMIVVVTLDKEAGQVVSGPDIISRGFVYVRESEDLMIEAKNVVRESLRRCEEKNMTEWSYMKNLIRDTLREFLWEKTKRSPMILPIIMEI